MAATGLALLGLAGIGWAARGSGEFAALSTAPLAFGLAQMAGSRVGGPAPRPSADPAAARAPVPCAPPAAPEAAPPAPAPERPPAQATAAAAPGLTADGRVILNRAGAAELQRLPAVGAKRAAAIVELRQRLGRFRRPSDLLRIRGIGPRTLERMLPMLVLDAG
jgi:competence protein ComEA